MCDLVKYNVNVLEVILVIFGETRDRGMLSYFQFDKATG